MKSGEDLGVSRVEKLERWRVGESWRDGELARDGKLRSWRVVEGVKLKKESWRKMESWEMERVRRLESGESWEV
jgi:hypothetical protein